MQDSHFLSKWSEQSFPRTDSFTPGCTLFSAGGMVQIGEWSRFSNQGQTFLRADAFSPVYTLLSVGGMARVGNGPGSEIKIVILLCLGIIVQIAHG